MSVWLDPPLTPPALKDFSDNCPSLPVAAPMVTPPLEVPVLAVVVPVVTVPVVPVVVVVVAVLVARVTPNTALLV